MVLLKNVLKRLLSMSNRTFVDHLRISGPPTVEVKGMLLHHERGTGIKDSQIVKMIALNSG